MRYHVKTDARQTLGHADSAQRAADIAANYLDRRQGEGFAYSIDTHPGNPYPVTVYREVWRGFIEGSQSATVPGLPGALL